MRVMLEQFKNSVNTKRCSIEADMIHSNNHTDKSHLYAVFKGKAGLIMMTFANNPYCL